MTVQALLNYKPKLKLPYSHSGGVEILASAKSEAKAQSKVDPTLVISLDAPHWSHKEGI